MKQYLCFYQKIWPDEQILYHFEYFDYTINFEERCKMVPLFAKNFFFPVKQNISLAMWKRFNMTFFELPNAFLMRHKKIIFHLEKNPSYNLLTHEHWRLIILFGILTFLRPPITYSLHKVSCLIFGFEFCNVNFFEYLLVWTLYDLG